MPLIRTIKPHFSRFLRLVALLTFASVVTVGGALYTSRLAVSANYGCLLTLHDNRADKLYDLATGAVAQYRYWPNSAPGLEMSRPSPDGRYVASLKPVGSATYRLVVEDTASGKTTVVDENAAHNDASTAGEHTALIIWSPDGSRFAYLWSATDSQSSFLIIAKADGSEKQRIAGASDVEGWSTDSAYLAFTSWPKDATGDSPLYLWSPAGLETYSLPGYRSFNAVWSPSSDQLAYVESPLTSLQPALWLTIVSPGKGLDARFALPPVRTQVSPEVDIPMWSLDGHYVALKYNDPTGNKHLDAYGIDGTALTGISTNMLMVWWRVWSLDGKYLTFFEHQPDGTLAWIDYDIAEKRYETIMHDITSAPSGDQQVLVTWQENGKLNVDLASADGAEQVTVVKDAYAILRADWSPDRSAAIVLWSNGPTPRGQMQLTWMRADGSQRGTIDKSIQNWTWLGSGKALVYTFTEYGLTSAWMVNMQTGAQYPLLQNQPLISIVARPGDQVALLWTDGTSRQWFDGYGPDGKLLYHFRADHAIPDPDFKVLVSPDGRTAAIATTSGPGSYHSLMLSSADEQSARVIRNGLVELGDILWSLDGKMLAFSEITPDGQWALEVITVQGDAVQRFAGSTIIPARYDRLLWTRCG